MCLIFVILSNHKIFLTTKVSRFTVSYIIKASRHLHHCGQSKWSSYRNVPQRVLFVAFRCSSKLGYHAVGATFDVDKVPGNTEDWFYLSNQYAVTCPLIKTRTVPYRMCLLYLLYKCTFFIKCIFLFNSE